MKLFRAGEEVVVNMMKGAKETGKIIDIKHKDKYFYYDIYVDRSNEVIYNIPQYMVFKSE